MTDCGIGLTVIDCAPGVHDCCALDEHGHAALTCSAYNGGFTDPRKQTWLMVAAFATMALMSFGIGANDAANSWGTSVGSGAVTLTQAVVTGGLMDWLGATLLGSGATVLMSLYAAMQTAWSIRVLSRFLSCSHTTSIPCRRIRHNPESLGCSWPGLLGMWIL